MKNYLFAYLDCEMTVCQAYSHVCNELAREDLSRHEEIELRVQKMTLQYHMASELMHKMGYVEREKSCGKGRYPATVWEVSE